MIIVNGLYCVRGMGEEFWVNVLLSVFISIAMQTKEILYHEHTQINCDNLIVLNTQSQ